jgi:hypothetical protein
LTISDVGVYFSSVRRFFGGNSDLANGHEHSDGLGSIAQGATDQVDRFEAQGRIEGNRILFGIYDYADATNAVPHVQSKLKHGA